VSVSRPQVVVHVAVSLDGATTGFEPDVGRFYALARTWREDVTLAGADTILAQERALADAPRPGPAADGPLLAVVDGRGRVRQWEALRDCGYWRDVLALHSAATPADARREPVREIVAGVQRVDLAAALGALLETEDARVVRVDSGGALIGALLGAALVDELSLLVHPCVAGRAANSVWHGSGPLPAHALELLASEPFDDGLVWLRYRTYPSAPAAEGRGKRRRKRSTSDLLPSISTAPERSAGASRPPCQSNADSVPVSVSIVASGASAPPRATSSRPSATRAWKR
jgi:2,5-diamino-6-(ribosylamino)-4(3H)-pyrimidinone 5'-phosphate reductase